jgi:lysozyme family protein
VSPAFQDALARTLGYEGGISDHPNDGGGLTKWGITERTYRAWRITTGQSTRSVHEMTELEMKLIYHDDYWKPCRCEHLPPRLAACVFDMAVNSGVGAAKLTLQRACKVKPDSVIGPMTLDAAAKLSPLQFLRERIAYVVLIVQERPDQAVFLKGWMFRILDQAWRAS